MASGEEERRKDRDEYKAFWRDTQRQIHELALETRLRFDQVADRLDQVGNRLDQVATTMENQQAETKRLDQRIDKLVSAIGQIIANPPSR
jgi:cell division septum initiation protein DivIVA